MKAYKFKDLTDEEKHSHFYQIILENTIWCAKPDSLNDPDEFKFELDYVPSSRTAGLLCEIVSQYRTTNYLPPHMSVSAILQNERLEEITAPLIEDVIDNCRNTVGIASFSATKTDDHLWSEYGGRGNGACIEIEIPDIFINDLYHPVRYVPERVFHIDDFLEAALFSHKAFNTYRNILLTKTRKWSQEEEVRFISGHPEVNVIIDGRIKEVTLGGHIPPHTMKQLESRISGHCIANGIRITKT